MTVSLRARLLLATLAASCIGLAVVGVLTYTLVTRDQLAEVDGELERIHPPIERAAAAADDREVAIRAVAPGFFVQLRTADGVAAVTIPVHEPGDDGSVTEVGEVGELPRPNAREGDDGAVFASIDADGEHSMRVRVSSQEDGSVLVIGRLLSSSEEAAERLLVALLAATAGAVLVIGLLGTWLVRIGLRPLDAVAGAAAGITDADLDRRVPGADGRTEVGRLAATINGMLDRLQGAFDQRQRDLAALQESEATMRRFVADASHELRTPIAATAAYAELFERGARERPDDLARAMAGIRSETARMSTLVDDLLLLAQLDEGRPMAATVVDLADVVIESADAASAMAPDRVVRVRVEDVVHVVGDHVRLRQVVDNLLGNVRTHTPPGTVCLVTVKRDGDDGLIVVADDGPGMGPHDAERAFRRFHRADVSRSRASGGAGLGLSIVNAIVTAHGGTVELRSDAGVGTTVTVRLPIDEEMS